MPYLQDSGDDLNPSPASEAVDSLQIQRADSMNGDGLQSLKSLPIRERIECDCGGPEGVIEATSTWNQTDDGTGFEDASPSGISRRSARASTRKLRVDSCPVRLTPSVPPVNYGAVERGIIYRSGFPDEHNLGFVTSLGIRSIMTLVNTTPSDGYHQYIHEYGINRTVISIAPNKEGKVGITMDSLCEALLFALNPTHYPLYIHCNQGRHRTGCVIGCLRKIQQWPLEEILAEYDAYASPKARAGDIDLITSFDPEAVYRYASSRGILSHWSRLTRTPVSRLTNVFSLATYLPRHKVSQLNDTESEDADFTLHPSSRSSNTIHEIDPLSFTLTEIDDDDECAVVFENSTVDGGCGSGKINSGMQHGSANTAVRHLGLAPLVSHRPQIPGLVETGLESAPVL